jgi:hypothetical protein
MKRHEGFIVTDCSETNYGKTKGGFRQKTVLCMYSVTFNTLKHLIYL